MIKYFCDSCGDEITLKNEFNNMTLKYGDTAVTIQYGRGTIDDACICKYCVIDSVNDLDDRLSEDQPIDPKVYSKDYGG